MAYRSCKTQILISTTHNQPGTDPISSTTSGKMLKVWSMKQQQQKDAQAEGQGQKKKKVTAAQLRVQKGIEGVHRLPTYRLEADMQTTSRSQ